MSQTTFDGFPLRRCRRPLIRGALLLCLALGGAAELRATQAADPPVADLGVSLSDGLTTAIAGTATSYTVTVTNGGPDAVTGLSLTLAVPPALLNPSYAPEAGSYTPGTGAWTGLSLASGGSVTLTLAGTLSPAATGTLVVTATVAPEAGTVDGNAANDTAADSDLVAREADLTLTLSDGISIIAPGQALTYTLTVTNQGPSRVDSLTLVDTLPSLLQSAAFTAVQGSYSGATGLWTGLDLGPGQSATLRLTGTVDTTATSPFVNSATVAPPEGVSDPVPGNNSATDTDVLQPLLTLVLSSDVTAAAPGQEVTYTIYYHNVGGSAATQVLIANAVPLFTTYVAGSLRAGSAASTYATATPLTDAADADVGQLSGNTIVFNFALISADDRVPGDGADEGKLFFKVKVD